MSQKQGMLRVKSPPSVMYASCRRHACEPCPPKLFDEADIICYILTKILAAVGKAKGSTTERLRLWPVCIDPDTVRGLPAPGIQRLRAALSY